MTTTGAWYIALVVYNNLINFREKQQNQLTFRSVARSVASSLPSLVEVFFWIINITIMLYGSYVFLKHKFFSDVKHSEL